MIKNDNVQIKKIRSFDGGMLQIECHDSVSSTSVLAKQYANAGYPDRYMVFSTAQTEFGVFGEKLSEGSVARGMFLSCILRPSMFPSQAGLLRALSAVAMTTALDEHTSSKLSIGWVSDIFCDKEKIGGVTLEGKLDNFTSYEYIIITFRLNISKDNFPPRLKDMIKSVFESDNSSKELIIAENIISKFFPLYFTIKNQTKFMDAYRLRFGMCDHKAKYISNGRTQRCKILSVDTLSGALILQLKNGETISVTSPANVILPKKIKKIP